MCSIEYHNWYTLLLHANTVEAYSAYWVQLCSKLDPSHGGDCQCSPVILEGSLVLNYCRVAM